MAIRHGCQITLVLAVWMYLAYRVASVIMGKGVPRFVSADAVAQAHVRLGSYPLGVQGCGSSYLSSRLCVSMIGMV